MVKRESHQTGRGMVVTVTKHYCPSTRKENTRARKEATHSKTRGHGKGRGDLEERELLEKNIAHSWFKSAPCKIFPAC